MKGIQITNGMRIPYAKQDDFVLNTEFLGGMKIGEKKTFIPRTDASSMSVNEYYYLVYPHRLDYVPAVIAFQGGYQNIGWQNTALIFQVSCNADNKNVYIVADYFQPDTPITLIIFYEKVADV